MLNYPIKNLFKSKKAWELDLEMIKLVTFDLLIACNIKMGREQFDEYKLNAGDNLDDESRNRVINAIRYVNHNCQHLLDIKDYDKRLKLTLEYIHNMRHNNIIKSSLNNKEIILKMKSYNKMHDKMRRTFLKLQGNQNELNA